MTHLISCTALLLKSGPGKRSPQNGFVQTWSSSRCTRNPSSDVSTSIAGPRACSHRVKMQITFPLRQVVTERRPNHVVNSMGLNSRSRRHVVVSGVAILGEVGVLNAPAHPSFGSLVEFVPKP